VKKVAGIFLVVFAIISCRKDESDVTFSLPNITQTGAQTFGFLLNTSTVWVNHGQYCDAYGTCRDNLAGTYYSGDGGITLRADRVIYMDGVAHVDTFELTLQTNLGEPRTYDTSAGDYMTVSYFPAEDRVVGYKLPGSGALFQVTIAKLDAATHVLSGEFTGTLFRKLTTGGATSTTDSIRLTSGRFDVKFP